MKQWRVWMHVDGPHPKNPGYFIGKWLTHLHIVHILNKFIQIIEKTVQSIAKNIPFTSFSHIVHRKLKKYLWLINYYRLPERLTVNRPRRTVFIYKCLMVNLLWEFDWLHFGQSNTQMWLELGFNGCQSFTLIIDFYECPLNPAWNHDKNEKVHFCCIC